MRPSPAAATTVRTLIAAIPDDRLRELFVELALNALAIPASAEPKQAPRNGRRRAWFDAHNAKRREQRRLAREAREAAPDAPQRGRPKANGAQPHGNGAVDTGT